MAIYKGTQALSMNGANGQNGANGANGYGIRCWRNYNETHNEYQGENGTGVNNTVTGEYSSCGGYGSVCNGSQANFVFGYQNELNAAQGNSVLGFSNKLTHGSQGCHVEGYDNWLKGSQGVHMEGYGNYGEGGVGCHIEGYEQNINLGATEGIHVEGFRHTGAGTRGLKFGAHIGGMEVSSSSVLSGAAQGGFFNGIDLELIGGQTDAALPGTAGGLVREMDEHGNMAIAGNFGCWIKNSNNQDVFVTIQDIYRMLEQLNPPV